MHKRRIASINLLFHEKIDHFYGTPNYHADIVVIATVKLKVNSVTSALSHRGK